jgi:transposase
MALAKVKEHLELGEIFRRYRECDCRVAKVFWQVIWLRAQGKKTAEVAAYTGFRVDWVRRLVRRYNSEGPDSIRDRRKDNGNEPMLSATDLEELRTALMGPAPDGGLWNSPKVAKWMSEKLQHYVSVEAGRVYLHKLGMTLKTVRPHSAKASKEAQAAFKKNFHKSWQTSKTFVPKLK